MKKNLKLKFRRFWEYLVFPLAKHKTSARSFASEFFNIMNSISFLSRCCCLCGFCSSLHSWKPIPTRILIVQFGNPSKKPIIFPVGVFLTSVLTVFCSQCSPMNIIGITEGKERGKKTGNKGDQDLK